MRRSEFILEVLNITGLKLKDNRYNIVYCDRSQSKNPDKQNKYFLRLKYFCLSDQVEKNFETYKNIIEKFLRDMGDNDSYVVLRKTSLPYTREGYSFIEIVMPKGLIWKNYSLPVRKQKPFKVDFNLQINMNGAWRFIQSNITVMAYTREEAQLKFQNEININSQILNITEK